MKKNDSKINKVKASKLNKLNKSRKRFAGYFVSLLMIAAIIASSVSPSLLSLSMTVYADDVVKNEKAQMDFTSSNSKGTVRIKVLSKTDKKVKVSIEKGDMKYTYDLNGNTNSEAYPLQWGNGEYNIKVLIQASDPNKYSVAMTNKFTLALKDDKAPFLNPNQLVNYKNDSKVVKKAAELVKGKTTEIEKVEAIYKEVLKMEYDTKKASTVQSGYLPDVDVIFDSKKGICFDYAAVFAAMLRSQGIPAKLVMGWVKVPNSKDPVYHAWNEFYLKEKGWFKVNEMKFDGKTFSRVDATFDSSNNSNSAVIKFIGDGSNYSKSYEF